jgi:DNA polymerase
MKIECEIPCGLSQRIVPGEGPVDAKVMLIGEAPGASEEIQLRPFVGKSGMLLRQVLESLKISPDSLYITNVLKCRPPKNRTPKPKEIECCSRILWKEISTIKARKDNMFGSNCGKIHLEETKKNRKIKIGK